MREILFRGKRLDTGEWVEGAFYAFYNFTKAIAQILRDRTNTVPDAVEVDPATVGQFTGLTDKNGKRIFEGDVLRITDRFGKFVDWRVKFRKGAFSVKHPDCNYWCGIGEFDGYTMEVIGNIRDNPELLEKEAEK